MTTLADLKKWEPWVNILKASKITQLAMQKWMAVVSSARELNVLKGIKSTTKELNLLSGFQGEVMSTDDIEVAPMISGRANGTGLGLPITHGIINQHNGMIECRSEPGSTNFRVLLPIGKQIQTIIN